MKHTYNISILVPGMQFNGDSLKKISLGGSETSGLSLSRELAKLGHNVKLFCNCTEPGIYDGVTYIHLGHWQSVITTVPTDIAIAQRDPSTYSALTNAKLNLLWCHDLALGRQADTFRAICWNIDKFITVSEFMKAQYLKVYGLPKNSVYASRNGIDLDMVPTIDINTKKRKTLIYSARPERGLDVMLDRIFPALLEKDPDFELMMFGYDNPVDHLKDYYNFLAEKARTFGDKVQFGGNLSKDKLYLAYAESGIYTYPTPSPAQPQFAEVSCISIMEAQACGMPVVSSNCGALSETLHPDAGILINGDPMSDEYRDEFVSHILKYATDDEAYKKASQSGMDHAKNMTWASVAKDWSNWFDLLFEEVNDDPARLANHFYRRSDIFSAKAALEQVTKKSKPSIRKNAARLQKKIGSEYAFTDTEAKLRAHNLAAGKATHQRLSGTPMDDFKQSFEETAEGRFLAIEKFLESHAECQNILEYGCGHGWSTVYLANKVGRRWTAVDIDPLAIEWASKFAKEFGKGNAEFNFVVGDHTNPDLKKYAPYDCLILGEVLEHCIDPYEIIDTLELLLNPGGSVIVTVPSGPSEFGTPNWYKHRGHLWEFEVEDLKDIFGKKPEYAQSSAGIYPNNITGEMIGYHYLTYIANHKPVGRIDMDRKLKVQRPRQTISANIIAGRNAEATMRWTFDSLKGQMDEIVLVDTGLSEEGLAIANSFEDVRIVKGEDPLVTGFDVPRNLALKESNTDWILWIDTDEKLIGSINLTKYLRKSIWHGLSIRQHHFSIDTSYTPDMPVRLFRTGPYSNDDKNLIGKKLKFIGRIHEHPELALNSGPGEILILPDIHIAHIGYLDEMTRRERFARNKPLIEMDQRDHPDRLLQKHFIMRDNMLVAQHMIQQNDGKINNEIKKLCEQCTELYRKHFLGKMKYSNIDSLQYYTEALKILGIGIDVQFMCAANREGRGDVINGQIPSAITARFMDYDEAKREIDFRLKQRMEPLQTTDHW